MGNCCDPPSRPPSPDNNGDRKVFRFKHIDHDAEIIRLFILGCGEVGKSTLIKQIQNLCLRPESSANYALFDDVWDNYQIPLSDEMRLQYRPKIYQNVFRIMGTLIDKVADFGLHYDSEENEKYAEELMAHIGGDVDLLYQMDVVLEPDMPKKIMALWTDRGIQSAWNRRGEFTSGISDSAKYFLTLEKLMVMATPAYRPVPDDIIRVRDPTIGMHDYNFLIHKVRFSIRDMGGQAVERTKIHHYLNDWFTRSRPQDKNFILYVAALSDYNKVLPEQHAQYSQSTRLDESIALLKVLINMPLLRHTGFILFLNKEDCLEDDLKRSGADEEFRSHFLDEMRAPRFRRGRFDDRRIVLRTAKNIICQKIEKEIERGTSSDRAIHVKFTRAVDPGVMEGIFHGVRQFVLEDTLANTRHHGFP